MWNLEPNNVVFFKTYNTEFDKIIIAITDQNGRPQMRRCFIGLRTRKYVKGYGSFSFVRQLSNKYGKQLLVTADKTGLDALKSSSKKVVHKAAEASSEFIENKIANKIVKSQSVIDENSRNIEEIIIPLEKRQEILGKLRQLL